MRTEGYWEHFLDLVKVEYQMLMYKKIGYKFVFNSLSDYVDNLGRVIGRDKKNMINAHYKIQVSDPYGYTMEREFSTIIPPEKILG